MFLKKHKNDILLILGLLLFAFIMMVCLRLFQTKGADAVVTIDGKTAAVLPLSKNTVQVFQQDGLSNTVCVEDGYVFVTEANCPNQDCVHQGKISKSGDTIVCLPHRLTVTIVSENDSDTDALSR